VAVVFGVHRGWPASRTNPADLDVAMARFEQDQAFAATWPSTDDELTTLHRLAGPEVIDPAKTLLMQRQQLSEEELTPSCAKPR